MGRRGTLPPAIRTPGSEPCRLFAGTHGCHGAGDATRAGSGAEGRQRSDGSETAAERPGTGTAECPGRRFYCCHTLEFSRKESAEIKEQAEILKALGFACLYSLERAGEVKEDIMEC